MQDMKDLAEAESELLELQTILMTKDLKELKKQEELIQTFTSGDDVMEVSRLKEQVQHFISLFRSKYSKTKASKQPFSGRPNLFINEI